MTLTINLGMSLGLLLGPAATLLTNGFALFLLLAWLIHLFV